MHKTQDDHRLGDHQMNDTAASVVGENGAQQVETQKRYLHLIWCVEYSRIEGAKDKNEFELSYGVQVLTAAGRMG